MIFIRPINRKSANGSRSGHWPKRTARRTWFIQGRSSRQPNRHGNKIEVPFNSVGSGLISRDGKELSHFEIAGEDGNFVPAQAEIDRETRSLRKPAV